MGVMNYTEYRLKADIDLSASGDNTVISAPGAGKYIVIDGLYFVVGGSAVDVQLKTGSTSYGGLLRLQSNQSIAIENTIQNRLGVITLGLNEGFVMNLSAAVNVGGFVRYRVIAN